jgi:hypothetical protein
MTKKNSPRKSPTKHDTVEKNLNSLDGGVTARPHDLTPAEQAVQGDGSMSIDPFDYGNMNEDDARQSGYIGPNGKAVSKSIPDKGGHPTGAYTDIGAGRSSTVVTKDEARQEDEARR